MTQAQFARLKIGDKVLCGYAMTTGVVSRLDWAQAKVMGDGWHDWFHRDELIEALPEQTPDMFEEAPHA